MTLLADDTSRSNGGGELRDLGSMLAHTQSLLTGTNGHDRFVDGSHPARVLGSVQDFQPGSPAVSVMPGLELLLPVGSRPWFSGDHYQQVRPWWGTILNVIRSDGFDSHQPSQEAVGWLVDAILDLYNRDRAELAADRLSLRPTPQRPHEIPQDVVHDSARLTLRMYPLRWERDTPAKVTNALIALLPDAKPDRWALAKYEQRSSTYDPVIYAFYGDWCIKVVKWP